MPMINSSILLSIIIPVYNVEKYLDRAIQSIVNTGHDNIIEILLVDDGSTDKSSDICDYYENKYNNVKTFHKANGGLSDARNFGLLRAHGRYVFFFDSDDTVDKTCFIKVLDILQTVKEDVVLWDAKIIDERDNILNIRETLYYEHIGLKEEVVYSGLSAMSSQIELYNDFPTTVWLGIYKKEFILKYGLWFEVSLLHEDELWSPKVLVNASSVKYIKCSVYNYRIRNNSIMNSQKKDKSKNLIDLIYIFNSLYSYYDWKIQDKTLCKCLKANVSRRFLHKLSDYNAYEYDDRISLPKWNIFRNSRGLKDRIRGIALCISIKLYCLLNKGIQHVYGMR